VISDIVAKVIDHKPLSFPEKQELLDWFDSLEITSAVTNELESTQDFNGNPNAVVITDGGGELTTDPSLEYPPETYTLGSVVSTGSANANNESGVQITGLTIGNWYSIEGTGGPYTAGSPPWPQEEYAFRLSLDGVTWTGLIGTATSGLDPTLVPYLDLPSFCAFGEWVDSNHGRVYFRATTTSLWFRTEDQVGQFADNTGTIGYTLYNASYGAKRITLDDVEYTLAKLGDAIHTATLKATPVSGDEAAIWDSATGLLKKAGVGTLGATDAANVTYTPSTNADWNGSADPGDVNDALDQLADRAAILEAAGGIAGSLWDARIIAPNGVTGSLGFHAWQENNIIYANGKSFVFWLGTSGGNFYEFAKQYDHSTKIWGTAVNISTAHANDTHNYLSAVIDSSGYFHVFYGAHATSIYYRKSTNPYDVSAWGGETAIATGTYPRGVIDSSGNIYLFYRATVGAGVGRYVSFIKSTNGGVSWGSRVDVADAGSDGAFAYSGLVGLGTDDSLHLVITWMDDNTGDQTDFHGVVYAKSLDGGTIWKKSDGTSYTLPLTQATGEYISTAAYLAPMQVTLDASNSPHVIYVATDPAYYFTHCDIHHAYINSGWQDAVIGGTGKLYDQSTHLLIDGDTFYIFSAEWVSGVQEVVYFKSLDAGVTWTRYQLTVNSTNTNINVVVKNTTTGGIEIGWGENGGNMWHAFEAITVAEGETDPVYTASEAALFAAGDAAKLAGIEAGAQVNNISNANATDLTDGGATTLHTHAGSAASYIVMESGPTNPPVPIVNSEGNDWVYSS
jgi:hypothetical protein